MSERRGVGWKMGKKITIYLHDDDLVRVKVLMKHLPKLYPMQKVSMSWLVRYGLYSLMKQHGLIEAELGEINAGGPGQVA